MFCVYLLILVAVSDGQDNFFLAVKNNEHTCVTNSSYGLTWITDYIDNNSKYVSEFIPLPRKRNFDCDISKDANTKTNFVKKPWMLKNSLLDNANNEIILDRRWEDLDIHLTDGYQNSATWQYMDVVLANLLSNFDIPFSVRIESDVNIFLCDGSVLFISDCYQFILDKLENGDRKSAIKACSNANGCSKTHFQNTHLVNKNVWSHFSLKKSGSYFTLRNQNQNEIILQLNDNTIRVTHMLISSVGTRGLWKFHELDYIYTNDETNEIQMGPTIDVEENFVCVSMFVSMCNSCQLKLTLKSDNVLIQKETFSQQTTNQQSKWFEIKFLADNISFNKSNLFVSTIGQHREERFWAIDKVRLCQKNEFRKISFPRAASCQLISDNNRVISSIPDVSEGTNNCPENTIGTFCIPCQRILRTCDKVQICNQNYLPASRTATGCWCSRELTNLPRCNNMPVGMPYDLHIKWTFQNDMLLEWKQSNVNESKIEGFDISIYSFQNENTFNDSIIIAKDEQISTYSYKVNASFLSPSALYTVEISAYNKDYKQAAAATDLSPPKKPSLQFPPKIVSSETTITVEIVPRPNTTANITVLVTDSSNISYTHPELKIDEPEILQHLSKSRTIYSIKHFNQNYSFVIGNGGESTQNAPLVPDTLYNVTLVLSYTFKNKTSYKIYFLNCTTTRQTPHLLGLLVLLLIPIVVITVYCNRRKLRTFFSGRKSPYTRNPSSSQIHKASGEENEDYWQSMVRNSLYDQNGKEDETNPNHQESILTSKVISISNFQRYVEESTKNGELKRQFKEVNSMKKQSDKIKGDKSMDYIDMVYADGSTIPRCYIASEIPKKSKVENFWRTICEQNINHVILLSSEDAKKTSKYWPGINERFEYDAIAVQMASKESFPGYELRKFNLVYKSEKRKVHHINFTYDSVENFVLLFSKLAEYPLDSNSPILIHSRKSLRRVGLVLLCDMSLRMAAKEGVIDVLKIFRHLHSYKPNFVDDINFYNLAHTVILEFILNTGLLENVYHLYSEIE